MAREWPNNLDLSFVDCSDHYEFLLQSHHIDEDLSKAFPVLYNTLLNIEPLDVLGVMDAIEAHYQKLDDFGKWCISKS